MSTHVLTVDQQQRAEAVRLASAAVRSGGPLTTGAVHNVMDVLTVASYIVTGVDYFETLSGSEAPDLRERIAEVIHEAESKSWPDHAADPAHGCLGRDRCRFVADALLRDDALVIGEATDDGRAA